MDRVGFDKSGADCGVMNASRNAIPKEGPRTVDLDHQRTEIPEGIRQDRQSTRVRTLGGILSDQPRPERELRNEAVTTKGP